MSAADAADASSGTASVTGSRAHGGAACCLASGERFRELLARDELTIGEWRCRGSDDTRATREIVVQGYEIVVTRQGAYARHTDVAAPRVLSYAGVVTFNDPHSAYQISHPLPGGDVCSVFRLTEGAVRQLLAETAPDLASRATPRFPGTDITISGEVYLRHRLAIVAARDAAGADALKSFAAEEWATGFLRDALLQTTRRHGCRGRTPEASNRYAADYAARVREIIARRFREPLTLNDVAQAVGASPFHLSRVIRAREGAPIYGLIVRLRLRAALEQVLETRDPLMAVALDAGFSSQSHFGDAFRKEFGSAPGLVRRLAQRHMARLPSRVRAAIS